MKISSSFHYGLLLSALYLSTVELIIGFVYLIAALPLFFFTSRFAKIPQEFFALFFVVSGGIWAVYLFRPLFLISNNDSFLYPLVGSINVDDHIRVLLQIALFSTIFLTSLYIAIFFPIRKKRAIRQDAITKKIKSNFLIRVKQPLILFMLLLLAGTLLLMLCLGGRFSAQTSLAAIIMLMLPLQMIIPLTLFYLIIYKYRLNYSERLFLSLILTVSVIINFINGSKAALLQVIMYVVILLLFVKGNFRSSIKKNFVSVLGLCLVLTLSFSLATAIKYFSLGAVSFETAVNMFYSALNFSDSGVFSSMIDKITGRFIGYDGLLVVNLAVPEPLLKIFNEGYILNHAIDKLVPGWSVPGMSLGKAVGMYYTGHTLEIKHAGGLGLFATLFIVGGSIGSYMYISMLGLLWGVLFRVINGLSITQQNKKLLSSIFCVQLVSWIISGNLERSISSFIILIVHIMFYYLFFMFLSQSIKPSVLYQPISSGAAQTLRD